MKKTSQFCAFALCLALSNTLYSQPTNNAGCTGVSLAGTWLSSIVAGPPGTPPQVGIQIYSEDGSYTGLGSPIAGGPPPALALGDTIGPSIGRWERISPTVFRLAAYSLIFKNGVVNGFFRVRDTFTLSENGKQFTSPGSQVDWLDINGGVVFTERGVNTGTRLESPKGCGLPGQ